MFKNMKLNMQLNFGFGLILVLLLITSVIAYQGLSKTYNGFVEYRGLAKDTNLAGRVQANMLTMRLSVLSFLNTRSESSIEQFGQRRKKMETFLAEAKVEIQNPKRAQLVSEVSSEVDVYKKGFSDVVDLFSDRNKVVLEDLDPAGLAMRKATTDVINSAYSDGDADAAFYASRVQENLLLGRLYVTKYLVTNAEKDALRALDELENKMAESLDDLDVQVENKTRRALLAEIKQNHLQYISAFKDVIEIIKSRNDLINNTLNKVGPSVANKIEQVKLSVKKDQDTLGPEVQENANSTQNLVGIISVLSLLIGIVISIVMAKIIRKPIGGEPLEIANITNEIAEGNLSQKLDVTDNDTGIYRSVAEMSSRLRELICSMMDTSSALINSAGHSTEIAEKNSAIVLDQKQMTDMVVVAIEEMSSSIQEVVQHASNSAEKSEVGLQEASKGREAVEATVVSVNELAGNLSDAMLVIAELEKQSNEIGSVIEVIQGISEQTNLLALNAAIEAARAGEQGRGFAVVADEVRTLAQRTQDSTAEIHTIINNLQTGTSKTVTVMKQSTIKANETAEQSEATNTALLAIDNIINEISSMNMQVATAVQEQSNVAAEITNNMSAIKDKLDETTETAHQAQSASSEVNEMANELNNMAAKFSV
jgi:methyl-accepting chemotaxis protein